MTVSLGKVAEHASTQRIELLGEQTDIVAAPEQAIKQPPRFDIAALQYIIVDEPKGACQKSAFARGQAVAGILGFIAQNEFILDQKRLLDGAKGPADAQIGSWKKTDKRDQQ